jgi:septal ring factor EnvC (AmiA/AmiB activator)
MNGRSESDGEHSRRKFRHIERALHHIEQRLTHMSAQNDSLNAQVDALQASVKNIRQDITDIKNSLPAFGGLTADEVAALSAKLATVVSDAAELDSENPATPGPQ